MQELIQLTINGLATAAMLALPAVSFSLVFAVLRLPYFAIAGSVTLGAYSGYWVNTILGIPFIYAIPVDFVISGLTGVLVFRLFIYPARSAGALTLAILSVAIAFLMENVARAMFGNAMRSFDLPLERDIILGFAMISPLSLRVIGVSVIVVILLHLFLHRTQTGCAIRATADNRDLASSKGINVSMITTTVIFIATGLAGIAGMMIGAEAALDPGLGFRSILSVFAATVVGGLGSIPGAIVGAIVIGLAEETSQFVLPATYKGAIGFVAIMICLTYRPRGIFGTAIRKDA